MERVDHHINLDDVQAAFEEIANRLCLLEKKVDDKNMDHLTTALNILSIQVEEIKYVIKTVSNISIGAVDGLNSHREFNREIASMMDSLQSRLREIIFTLEK